MELLVSISLPAKPDSLAAIMDAITGCAVKQGADLKKAGHIELVLEEALVNVFTYAYPEGEGDVEVLCSIDENKSFIIEIIDCGPPFNPLSENEPDVTAGIDEREIGGLGIFFMKQFTDNVEYFRKNQRNILKITKML